MADDVLRQGVQGISDIIQVPAINVDFADVKSIMSNAGTALMSIGMASGERAAQAAQAAISVRCWKRRSGRAGCADQHHRLQRLRHGRFDTVTSLVAGVSDGQANIITGVLDENASDSARDGVGNRLRRRHRAGVRRCPTRGGAGASGGSPPPRPPSRL